VTQAGQDFTCDKCKQVFEVPQLQVLNKFEIAEASSSSDRKTTASAGRDILFVVGLICLILGSAAGYGLNRYSNSLIYELENEEQKIVEQADSFTPGRVLLEWYYIEKEPDLPEWQEHPIIGNQKQGKILKNFAYGLWGIGGVGLLLLGYSLMFRSQSS
jgi:hypothetical protein